MMGVVPGLVTIITYEELLFKIIMILSNDYNIHAIPSKSMSFPEISGGAEHIQNQEDNSQKAIFVAISCPEGTLSPKRIAS